MHKLLILNVKITIDFVKSASPVTTRAEGRNAGKSRIVIMNQVSC